MNTKFVPVSWAGRCGEKKYYFFFQAEDGIRDLVRSRGLGMCIRASSGTQHFDGTIREVKIFNSELTAAEVGDL